MRAALLLILFHFCPFTSALLLFAYLAQARDDLFDEPVGRRGPGRDADAVGASEVVGVDLFGRLDEVALRALLFADREELEAVRRVLAADDVEGVHVAGERARRVLP